MDTEAYLHLETGPGDIHRKEKKAAPMEHLKALFPELPEAEIVRAFAQAIALRSAVRFHPFSSKEPSGDIREKYRMYLREKVPGLSDRAYEAAVGMMMWNYR